MQHDEFVQKFCIPFTGDDPDEFNYELLKREWAVHDVYLGMQIFPQHHVYYDDTHAVKWLELNNNRVPVFFTLNSVFEQMNDEIAEQLLISHNIVEFLQYYKITGVIVAEFAIMRVLKRLAPWLCICSSVNSKFASSEPLTTLNDIDILQLNRGCFVSNTNNAKQKTKVILNDACVRHCTHASEHLLREVRLQNNSMLFKKNMSLYDFICTCVFFPRWTLTIARQCDLLKLCGRPSRNKWFFTCFDSYLSCDNDITFNVVCNNICGYIPPAIPLSLYDDDQLFCEERNCNECNIYNLVKKRIDFYVKTFGVNLNIEPIWK